MEEQLKLLIIDDNDADIEYLARLLDEVPGYSVSIDSCMQAGDAEKMLSSRQYDVVYIDHNLGKLKGAELIEKFSVSYPHTAFILLTGEGHEGVVVASLRAGAADYLNKLTLNTRVLRRSLGTVTARLRVALQFRLLMDTVSDAVVILDDGGIIQLANPAMRTVFGYEAEELAGEPVKKILAEEGQQAFFDALNCLKDQGKEGVFRHSIKTKAVAKSGAELRLEFCTGMTNVLGKKMFLSVIRDAGENNVLNEDKERQAAALELIHESVVFFSPELYMEYINSAGARLIELQSGDTISSISVEKIFSESSQKVLLGGVVPALKETGSWSGELELVTIKTSKKVSVSVVFSVQKDKEGIVDGYTAIIKDITADHDLRGQLKHLVTHDTLTGLANRGFLVEHLGKTLASAKRYRHRVVLMFLDLDGFKSVNDRLGHAAGDEVLCCMANILRSNTRESDILVRLGGDEFVVLVNDISEIENVELFADKILKALSAPLTIKGQIFTVTPSIGIAMYPDNSSDSELLLQSAEAAMYQAKEQGCNRHVFFKGFVDDDVELRRKA